MSREACRGLQDDLSFSISYTVVGVTDNIQLAPTSFCKCTCFSNSTIIPLDPAKPSSSSSPESPLNYAFKFHERSAGISARSAGLEERKKKYRALNCNDCTRKFCLGYDLPTCKGAKEDDVVTTCFRMSCLPYTILFSIYWRCLRRVAVGCAATDGLSTAILTEYALLTTLPV